MKYVKFVYFNVEIYGNLVEKEKLALPQPAIWTYKIEVHENFLSKTKIAFETDSSPNKNRIIVICRYPKEITEITEEEYIAALVLES